MFQSLNIKIRNKEKYSEEKTLNNLEYKSKLVNFIKDTNYEALSDEVKAQVLKCFLDLAGVICAGAKNNSSKKAAKYVKENYPVDEYTILSTGEKTNLIGAALANGMSANALDMDDGYSLLRGHPGAGFFGGVLSAAEHSNCTYGEFLAAIVVAYEISIREGYAIRDFYGWDHSSGSYGAFATAASIAKLLKLSDEKIEMALGIADFILPVVPAKRSCYVPSMNKDGIYWGQHVGAQAVAMAKSGISGKNPVILDDKYLAYIDSLGEKYYLFDLYIKFYSCCRWAHSPIYAVNSAMSENNIESDEIQKIDVYSFGNAGTLYRCPPTNEDEAQYNIIYPIAAQVLFGDCGPLESSTTKMLDARVAPMMEKIEFHHEPEYDKVFPAQRLSRVEITTVDGRQLVSDAFEPRGDHNAEVSIEDIKEKIYKANGIYAPKEMIDEMIDSILNTSFDTPFVEVYEKIKLLAATNMHPEIEFI